MTNPSFAGTYRVVTLMNADPQIATCGRCVICGAVMFAPAVHRRPARAPRAIVPAFLCCGNPSGRTEAGSVLVETVFMVQAAENRPLECDDDGKRLDAATVKLWLTDPKGASAKFDKKSTPPMKSFASLPPEDIDALFAYVMSLK